MFPRIPPPIKNFVFLPKSKFQVPQGEMEGGYYGILEHKEAKNIKIHLEILLKISKNYRLILEFSSHIYIFHYIFHYTQFYTQFGQENFLPSLQIQ